MKIIKAGHKYELANMEDGFQTVTFIHKDIQGDSTDRDTTNLVTIEDGTTNEQVLEMMIDRMNHLQSKMPCRENAIVITKLEESLMWLNKRTQGRIARNVEGKLTK